MRRFIKRNAEKVKSENGYSLYIMKRDGCEYCVYLLSKRFSKY